MSKRHLTARDRAFLERHRQLAEKTPSRGSSEPVEIAGEQRLAKRMSILWFDGAREVWLPKVSIIAQTDDTVTIPEWLAKDRGLI
jgi:hypothetical protein